MTIVSPQIVPSMVSILQTSGAPMNKHWTGFRLISKKHFPSEKLWCSIGNLGGKTGVMKPWWCPPPFNSRLDACCPTRFEYFEVRIGDTPATQGTLYQLNENPLCDSISAYDEVTHPERNRIFTCPGALSGRYLTVQKPGKNWTVAEVYVVQDGEVVVPSSELEGSSQSIVHVEGVIFLGLFNSSCYLFQTQCGRDRPWHLCGGEFSVQCPHLSAEMSTGCSMPVLRVQWWEEYLREKTLDWKRNH